ncbi:MAG: nitrous oxide-stimulated promoter family protein [Thermodesulfovibrionales bacterium]|jgi:hypothetical protein
MAFQIHFTALETQETRRQDMILMPRKRSRMIRERRTIDAMIGIYCRHHGGTEDAVCPECKELWDYAQKRLDQCPFQEGKTTCANCKIHCYNPVKREKIREVMRYAGPRMIPRHPLLALFHFLYGFRKKAHPAAEKPRR